jgi:hypothetical protein
MRQPSDVGPRGITDNSSAQKLPEVMSDSPEGFAYRSKSEPERLSPSASSELYAMNSILDQIKFTRSAELIEDEHIYKRPIVDLFLAALLRPSFLESDRNRQRIDNEDLVKLTVAGLPASVIVRAIELYGGDFDISRSALLNLDQRGIGAKVIEAMRSKQFKTAA